MNTWHKVMLIIAIAAVIVIPICFAFKSCGHELTEGEVYQKEYHEARTVVRFIPITTYNGKTTTTRLIPYLYRYPDRWIIYIREPNGDGTYTTDYYYTTEEVYNSVEIGNTFCYDPDRDFEDEPYTRERQES